MAGFASRLRGRSMPRVAGDDARVEGRRRVRMPTFREPEEPAALMQQRRPKRRSASSGRWTRRRARTLPAERHSCRCGRRRCVRRRAGRRLVWRGCSMRLRAVACSDDRFVTARPGWPRPSVGATQCRRSVACIRRCPQPRRGAAAADADSSSGGGGSCAGLARLTGFTLTSARYIV